MAVVTIPKVLREKLSDEGADALVELINKADDKQKEDILKFLEEKFEVKLEAWGERLETKLSAAEKTIEEKFEVKLETVSEKLETKLSAVEKTLEEKFEAKLSIVEEKFEAKLSIVEEKFERRLAEEIGKVRTEIVETKASLRNEIAETKAALEVKIESVKSEIIKWMFIFWVGQFAAIVGTLTAILFAFFRK